MRVKGKRVLAYMVCALLLVAGCGGRDPQGGSLSNAVGQNGQKDGTGATDQTLENRTVFAKGRYMEKEIPCGAECVIQEPAGLLYREGGLYVMNLAGQDARVELEGAEQAALENVGYDSVPEAYGQRIKRGGSLSGLAVAENGARMYARYYFTEEGEAYQTTFFLSPAGEESEWDAGGEITGEARVSLVCGRDGYFYVLTQNVPVQKLFRVSSETGETECLAEFGDVNVYRVMVCGGKLFALTKDRMGIYDLETMEELERDRLLEELLRESWLTDNGDYATGFLLYPGKDDSLYVATDRGLYRHVLYGSVSELLIDGAISSLGDISKLFAGMYVEENTENGMPVFYFLYSNKSLVRFAYDPEASTVPENIVSIYSLYENSDIRLAITAYQTLYPERYVRYEVGLNGQDGATREDALSNLATRIAAGEGPDIFLMDDLPFRSYMDKGVLMDLDSLYGDLKAQDDYFDNIIDLLRSGDNLYMIPMMFDVPMMMGERDNPERITDTESLVRAVENAGLTPDPDYESTRTGLYDAYLTLLCMSYTNSGDWMDESGRLDQEALKEFLTNSKRIYDADEGLRTEGELERDRDRMQWQGYVNKYVNAQKYREALRLCDRIISLYCARDVYSFGLLDRNIKQGFNYCYAFMKKAGLSWQLMPGMGRTAIPYALLGVNAATPVPEAAGDFVRYALSDYLRTTTATSGLPINRDVLLEMEQPTGEEAVEYGFMYRKPDGDEEAIYFTADWQKPEVYEEFNDMLDSLDTVNCCEYEVLSVVLEEGVPALTGEKTIEEAVNAIAKRIQLYLAE